MAACDNVGERVGSDGYLLGIDVGTSTIKVVLVSKAHFRVVQEQCKSLGSHLKVQVADACERSVDEIFSCVEDCISSFSPDSLEHVVSIGVCGQMHGCVLWKSIGAFFRDGCLHYEQEACSNFVTWQDGRCTRDFLSSLPLTCLPIRISAGYGCATLAWLQRFQPKIVRKFDRAGTIMDLLVCALCGDPTNVVMSAQNAASWGYFDIDKMTWEKELLERAEFPVQLLPKAMHAPCIAGALHGKWHGIPEGTPLGIAMGDLQCSILAAHPTCTDAVLNIGSASQLAVIKQATKLVTPLQSVMEVPYFSGDNILVAAALGGGKVIATFVSMLKEWLESLGVQRSDSELYKTLMTVAKDKMDTTLQVVPTLWGERHRPDMRGSVHNIGMDNLTLGDVSSAMFRGIVENLTKMMPREIFQEHQIQRIIGSGYTLQRNTILQQHTEKVFGLSLVIKEGIDSPLGAAVALEQLQQ